MDVEDILSLNPKSECEITLTFREEWKHCYHQFINKSNADVDPNKLPLLDDEYLGDTGEPLENDDGREVFDPTQEIHYELYFEVKVYEVYTSKTFINILQKKVKDLISSGKLSEDSDSDEVKEVFEMHASWGPDSLGGSLLEGCKDLVCVENINEYDNLLWCTSSQLDEEDTYFDINEI
tara:strand:+ start:53 stop:589 length:537 start_codon:yes stop_codon:yes gene_type:complete